MENREKILQCAEELFYSKGYDAAGVQEIVERAGVTKPTLYYYYGSKRGLLEAILETKFCKVDLMLEHVLQEPGDIRSRLHALASEYCRFFMEEQKFYMLMMALFYSARENEAYQVVEPYLKHFSELIVKLFEQSADMLGNMNGRQRQFAITMIGMLNQVLMADMDPDQDPEARYQKLQNRMYAVTDQFMHGIFS